MNANNNSICYNGTVKTIIIKLLILTATTFLYNDIADQQLPAQIKPIKTIFVRSKLGDLVEMELTYLKVENMYSTAQK